MTSVHELGKQMRAEARREVDDSPKRSRRLWPLGVAGIAVIVAAQFWLFLHSNPDGPFSTIDHNLDDDWVRVERFEQHTIVLEDGRRFLYPDDAPVPPALVALRPGRYRERFADGSAGEWQVSELGLFVDVDNADDVDEFEITVWHMPAFAYTPIQRTWNPFAEAYEVWKVHHSATVRQISSQED